MLFLIDSVLAQSVRDKTRLTLVGLAALCITSAGAQSPSPDLDAISKRVITQERVVGASVLVARGNQIIFRKGYGFADLGLEARANAATVYAVV